MSIINVWINQDYALVGADSECQDAAGNIDQVSKIIPLVHMNAVLSGCGHHLFINNLWSGCHSVGGDFDVLISLMPKILPLAYKSMLESARRYGIVLAGDYTKQTAIICGWSKRHDSMIGYSFTQLGEAAGFSISQEIPAGACHLQPAHPRQFALPCPGTPEGMRLQACEQAAFIKRSGLGVHAGGEFIVAKIERSKMTIWPVCDLNNEVVP